MRKETMHCHTVSPAKTFSNRLQYLVIECRIYLPPQETESKVKNFQHHFQIEFK